MAGRNHPCRDQQTRSFGGVLSRNCSVAYPLPVVVVVAKEMVWTSGKVWRFSLPFRTRGERQAQMATRGEYYVLGAELSKNRRGDVGMNTPIDTVTDAERVSQAPH